MSTATMEALLRIPSEVYEAALAIDSLAEFSRFMWPVIEPGAELVWNWHLDAICSELTAVTDGKVTELGIAVPPGTAKSIEVSVFWPAWEWLRFPHLRNLHISNSDRLCVRDSRRMRDVVTSRRYAICMAIAAERGIVRPWSLSDDQAEKVHFANTHGGFRLAIPTMARVTGDRGDKLVLDDPVDAQEAVIGTPDQVMRRMEEVQHRYDHVWASRLNNPSTDPRVVIMQCLAPGDLIHVLQRRGVRVVVLPMEYEPDHPYRYEHDPRTEPGELLFPSRFPRAYIDKLKATPGAGRHYTTQYQQRHVSIGAGVFRREWFRYFDDDGDHYTLHVGYGNHKRVMKSDCWRVIVSDNALSDKKTACFSVIQVWDVVRHEHQGVNSNGGELSEHTSYAMLIDQWRGQVTAPDYEDQIERMRGRWKPLFAAIEETTASKAIIDRMRHDNILIRGLSPKKYGGDKTARAYAASIQMEAAKVFFPGAAAWLPDLESELENFGPAKDQIDTTTYAILLVSDKDMWIQPAAKKLTPGAIGTLLGHDKVLPQYGGGPRGGEPFDPGAALAERPEWEQQPRPWER